MDKGRNVERVAAMDPHSNAKLERCTYCLVFSLFCIRSCGGIERNAKAKAGKCTAKKVVNIQSKMQLLRASLLVLASVSLTQPANAGGDMIMLTKENWGDMLESGHGWFINICRQG